MRSCTLRMPFLMVTWGKKEGVGVPEVPATAGPTPTALLLWCWEPHSSRQFFGAPACGDSPTFTE